MKNIILLFGLASSTIALSACQPAENQAAVSGSPGTMTESEDLEAKQAQLSVGAPPPDGGGVPGSSEPAVPTNPYGKSPTPPEVGGDMDARQPSQ